MMKMGRWEYKTLKHQFGGWTGTKINIEDLDGRLNLLGAEGWELASSFDTSRYEGASTGIVMIFKRWVEA